MTDDLVKRLRLIGERRQQCTACYRLIETADEAADRIEKLEAALQAYVGDCDTTCCSPNHRRRKECGYTARKALEGKDEKGRG